MESRPLVWSAMAERDLASIYDYLRARSKGGTRTIIEGILQTLDRVSDHPEMGASALDVDPHGAVRHIPFRECRIFYLPQAARIYVVRIWHSRRDPGSFTLGGP